MFPLSKDIVPNLLFYAVTHLAILWLYSFRLLLLTLLLFVFIINSEFPANEIVRFLVGFTNKGSQDFTVQSLEASFRYPQDYQFYIQNVILANI